MLYIISDFEVYSKGGNGHLYGTTVLRSSPIGNGRDAVSPASALAWAFVDHRMLIVSTFSNYESNLVTCSWCVINSTLQTVYSPRNCLITSFESPKILRSINGICKASLSLVITASCSTVFLEQPFYKGNNITESSCLR